MNLFLFYIWEKSTVVRKFFFPLLTSTLLLAACNETQNNGKKDDADSVSANEKPAYAKSLVNVSAGSGVQQAMAQAWQLEEDLEALQYANEPEGMVPFRGIYLSPDNTYTKNLRNDMEYGRWEYNDAEKTLRLKKEKGGGDTYKIVQLSKKELQLVDTREGNGKKLKYVAEGKQYLDKNSDPFHIDNNRWRTRTSSAETEAAIRDRVKQFVRFHVLFYRDNIARESKTISFYGFPTCLKWYAGGIFIIKKEELPQNWFNCFYNKEQAMKAYAIMDGIIGKKYNWPKGKMNWVNKNLAVLEQMYEKL
jgi:hypothetical protein